MMQLCLLHTQVAERGAESSLKGSPTRERKSKHWKCWESSSKRKKTPARPASFIRSHLVLKLNFISGCKNLLGLQPGGLRQISVFSSCVPPEQTGSIVLVASNWTQGKQEQSLFWEVTLLTPLLLVFSAVSQVSFRISWRIVNRPHPFHPPGLVFKLKQLLNNPPG